MKKKILATVLAGAMMISSATVVSAVWTEPTTSTTDFKEGVLKLGTLEVTDFFTEKTQAFLLPTEADYTITLKTKTHATVNEQPSWAANVWVAIATKETIDTESYIGGDQELLTIQADRWCKSNAIFEGFNNGCDDNDNFLTDGHSFDNWFADTMKDDGLGVTVNLTRDGNTIEFSVEYANGYHFNNTATSKEDLPDELYVFLSAGGAGATLTDITVTDNNYEKYTYIDGNKVTEKGFSQEYVFWPDDEEVAEEVTIADFPSVLLYTSADGTLKDYKEVVTIEFSDADNIEGKDALEEFLKNLTDDLKAGVQTHAILKAVEVKGNYVVELRIVQCKAAADAAPVDDEPELKVVREFGYVISDKIGDIDGDLYATLGYTENCFLVESQEEAEVLNLDGIELLDDLDVTGFDATRSKTVEITKDGFELYFSGKTYANAVENFNTPIYILSTNSGECIFVRSDLYGWLGFHNPNTNENIGNFPDGFKWNVIKTLNPDIKEGATDEEIRAAWDAAWAAWLESCKAGIDGNLCATRDGENVVVTYTVNGITSEMQYPVGATTPAYISLTGDQCSITDIVKAPFGMDDEDLLDTIVDILKAEDKEKEPGTSGPGTSDPGTSNPGTSTPSTPSDDTDNNNTTKPDVTTNATLKSDDGTVAVSGNLPAGVVKVNVVAPTIKAGDTKATFDITLLDGNGNPVQLSEGQKVTVTIKIPDEFKSAKELFVYYQKNGKIVENMNAKKSADGTTISFETTHFSEYVISTTALKVESENNPTTGVALVLIPAVAAAAAVLVSKKRK